MPEEDLKKDPGFVSETVAKARRALREAPEQALKAYEENRSGLRILGGDEELPSPVVYGSAISSSFPKESSAPEEVPAWAPRLIGLVNSPATSFFTLKNADVTLDFDVLAHDIESREGGWDSYRFILPESTSVKLRPSENWSLIWGGNEIPVAFLGDIFDFDGLLPFKVITFISRS